MWAPLADVAAALCGDEGAAARDEYPSARVLTTEGGGVQPPTGVDAKLLAGVYPNMHGEGVGRGHLWALRRLLERQATSVS